MIISKPKNQTLFSLITFIIICFGIGIYTGYQIFVLGSNSFWTNLLFGIFTPLGLAVIIKIFSSYKTLYIGKEKLDVVHLWGISKKRYNLKDMLHWFETSIKTYNGIYKELTMHFPGKKKLKLTEQENQAYNQVKKYLKKKFSGKETKSPQ